MINHNEFIIEHAKPEEDHYFLFRIVDPERNKKYNTLNKMLEASKKNLFISGVYFIYDIPDLLKNGYFDKIKYTTNNNQNILTYIKKGEIKHFSLTTPFKANHFTVLMRDAGYEITLEFKDKAYKRKKNLYDYNIVLIKERLQNELFREFLIQNKSIGKEIFEKCWKDNNGKTLPTQIAFMKQLSLFKKIGEIV